MMAIPLQHAVEYPESDGRPMGETELHIQEIMDLIAALADHFREAVDVHVGGDLLLYYAEGDPRSVVCPDVFVTHGMSKEQRRVYKLWEEGRVPSLVIEVTSRSTRDEDLRRKKGLYERLGVAEYVLHDPLGEYLAPPLQGYRLEARRYVPIAPAGDGSLASATTGLLLHREGRHLRLVDAVTGQPLLRIHEEQAARRAEQAARREEQAARHAAEARARAAEEELERLRRELERLRNDGERS